jgi:dTDP-4-dehydrorhamnose reductase
LSKILLIGGSGQIGWELARALLPLGTLVIADRVQCDLTKPQALAGVINAARPTIVINAAAYTSVDKAEAEPTLAMTINADASAVLAMAARQNGALFVHYSTDYVFDGGKEGSYIESDSPHPLSAYGRSKLAGECAVREAGGDYLIFRTSWVYASRRQNFLRTMLRLASEREQLRVVADQVGAPTWARLIAECTALVLQQDVARRRDGRFEGGLIHLTAAGETTWHGFASAIIATARAQNVQLKCRDIVPISTADYPLPARRPANSRLDGNLLEQRYGLRMPPWEIGMQLCLAELFGGMEGQATTVPGPGWSVSEHAGHA